MSSASLLDRSLAPPSPPSVQELLVLWQHPDTREFIPIGRFNHDGGTYTFVYTRAVEGIDGFRPLPGMPDLHNRYASRHMPAVFDQRIMPPSRPDYQSYLATLGLNASHATPWEQIVESGGRRNGDTLQFMQVPNVADGLAQARFLVNGVRHASANPVTIQGHTVQPSVDRQEAALRQLHAGDLVNIFGEDNNAEDKNASIVTSQGVPLGWVPRPLSAGIRGLLARTCPLSATVVRVAPPKTPPHLRLVLDIHTPAPPGFSFDPAGSWEPTAEG